MPQRPSSCRVISSDRVEGTVVYSPTGEQLGSIDDLMIDKVSGQVRYAVLEFGGFLGMGTDRFPLPWSVLKYDTSMEGYVVPLDRSTLDRAPRFREGQLPEFTDDVGRGIYSHYGVAFD